MLNKFEHSSEAQEENHVFKILPLENSIPCDALAGYRVIELAEYVSGPSCGRVLADYGAEVIKIERPSGDFWRGSGKNTKCGADPEENPVFEMQNAGKKSVVLNLKEQGDMDKLHALLRTADVFLTNNRMVSLKKMGLDPESLQNMYPSIVYGLVTGYGIDGAERNEPGFDSVSFWGRSGFMRDVPYAGEIDYPIPPPLGGIGDIICGVTLVTGLLAALLKRERTGRGDFVTTSLLSSAMWVNNTMILSAQPKYGDKFPISRIDTNPLACGYQCADGEWVQIGINDYARYVPMLMEVLGVPELIHDPRFATHEVARTHYPELLPIFEKQFRLKPSNEWMELIKNIDIVCCKLPHFRDVVDDQQAWDNGYLENFTFRNNNTCVMVCPPVRFGSTGGIRSKWAPLLGEHTDEVMKTLDNQDNI